MRKNSILIILGILFGLNLLAWVAVGEFGKSDFLEVTFFDIGQGDSILIETPYGQRIVGHG